MASYADRLDFLNLRGDLGKFKAFTFYSAIHFGLCLIILSVVLFAYNAQPNQKEMLQARHSWLQNSQAQQLFSGQQSVLISVVSSKNTHLHKDTPMKLISNEAQFNSYVDQTLGLTAQTIISIPQQYFSIQYPRTAYQSKYICGSWKITTQPSTHQTAPSTELVSLDGSICPDNSNNLGLNIKLVHKDSYPLTHLAEMGLCSDNLSADNYCGDYCQEHDGILHHSGGIKYCKANFYLADYCATIHQKQIEDTEQSNSLQQHSQLQWAIKSGCYNYKLNGQGEQNSFYQWTLDPKENQGQFTITMRHADDPNLQQLSVEQQQQLPNTQKKIVINDLQQKGRTVFIIGAIIVVFSLALAILSKKKNK